jgi:hypothetical protein
LLAESVLAPRCLSALETLYDHDGDASGWGRRSLSATITLAVSEVLAVAQQALQELDRDGESNEFRRWFDVGRWQGIARDHGSDYMKPSEMKRIELDASDGSPLAVCGVTSVTVKIPFFAAFDGRTEIRNAPLVKCHHRSFPDRAHAEGGGQLWSSWCPECRPNTGQVARKTDREIRRRFVDHALILRQR